ncbi:MAG: copper amine oxidase N-terminal domain-containing protein [Clostridia bacterium]|nr:copper amine oxidase N-terminal domain-containing protein [Clostridia bacterium]
MAKKLLAMMLVLVMACSFVAFAEEAVGDGTTTETQGDVMLISAAPVDTTPRVVLEATEPDADGYFTLDITLYNATYKGIVSAISYDTAVVTPVNKETKEATTELLEALSCPIVAKDLETGAEIADWQSFKGSKMKDGLIAILAVTNTKVKIPNSIVSDKFQALADENGLAVAQISMKKLSDAPIEFKLAENNMVYGGMMVINSYGMQDCTVEFKYPDGKTNSVDVKGTNDTLSSDKTAGNDMVTRKQLRAENVVFLQIDNYGTVANGTLKWVDKTNKGVKPYIKNNRTMVPLRYIAEELKCKVDYVEETREILIENGKTKLVFQIDSLSYTNDGLKKTMDVAPEIVESRTFVPLRAVSEALNCDVQWLEAQRMVIVSPANYPWNKDNDVEKQLMSEIMLMLTLRDYAYASQAQ